MVDHTSILSRALMDYTDWLIKQKGPMAGSVNELKGIFYNKLLTCLREHYSGTDLRNTINVTDFSITIEAPGFITGISFDAKEKYSRTRLGNDLLVALDTALLNIDVGDYRDKFSYELGTIIYELKKSLNHG